jgi:hypothetical protein
LSAKFFSDFSVPQNIFILKADFVSRKKEFVIERIGAKSIFTYIGLGKRWPSTNRTIMLSE